jgi:hypothetical protein
MKSDTIYACYACTHIPGFVYSMIKQRTSKECMSACLRISGGYLGRTVTRVACRRLSPPRLEFIRGQSIWDMWCTKWHLNRVFFPRQYHSINTVLSFIRLARMSIILCNCYIGIRWNLQFQFNETIKISNKSFIGKVNTFCALSLSLSVPIYIYIYIYLCLSISKWLLKIKYVLFSYNSRSVGVFFRVQLPWLRFFRAFSSVVRQMPKYNSPRRGTPRTVSIYFCVVLCIVFCVVPGIVFVLFCVLFLCCSMYCLFCVVLCTVCV